MEKPCVWSRDQQDVNNGQEKAPRQGSPRYIVIVI